MAEFLLCEQTLFADAQITLSFGKSHSTTLLLRELSCVDFLHARFIIEGRGTLVYYKLSAQTISYTNTLTKPVTAILMVNMHEIKIWKRHLFFTVLKQ